MVFIVLVIGIMKIYLEWMKGSFDPITLLVVLVPLVAMISFIYATIWNKRQWKDDEEFMREIIKDLFKDTLVNT
jgi:energy-coupling factor transporter transmembrane protein EcfT